MHLLKKESSAVYSAEGLWTHERQDLTGKSCRCRCRCHTQVILVHMITLLAICVELGSHLVGFAPCMPNANSCRHVE